MGRGRSAATRDLLEAARDILETIQPCSVRAICYQLFTRGRIPSMAKPETNRISTLLTWAREEDEIPFDWIVQEGRAIEQVSTWADPAAFARTVQAAYRRNKWAGQAQDLIVVSEKGTVRGTLGPVLDTYEVDFFPVGGYGSTTRVYELAQRATPTRPLVILYLGDYDPSGLHMSAVDLPRRLAFQAHRTAGGVTRAESRAWVDAVAWRYLAHGGLVFRRLALTDEDTQTLGPRVSFPASDKATDPRATWFVQRYGRRCWELDAMNPNTLRTRVEAAIAAEIEPSAWTRYVTAERVEQASIVDTLATWNRISGLPRNTTARASPTRTTRRRHHDDPRGRRCGRTAFPNQGGDHEEN